MLHQVDIIINFNCIRSKELNFRYKKQEDAAKAEAENGMLFEGHRLRVHCCLYTTKPDETKAIFIGNLSFGKDFVIVEYNCRQSDL